MKQVRRLGSVPVPSDAPPHLQEALAGATTDTARARAYLALSQHYRFLSLESALPLAQAALEAALSADAPDATVEVLAGLSALEVTRGRQEQAFEHLALALDLAHEHGLHHLEARVHNVRAIARLTAGDLSGARRDLFDVQALAQTSGNVNDRVNAHVNLAYLANLSGHYADSLHQLNLLEELLLSLPEEEQRASWPYLHENRTHTYLNLARQARERGRPDTEAEARARSHAALEAARVSLALQPDHIVALNTETHAARLALLEGDLDSAQVYAEAAMAYHRQLGQRAYLEAYLAMAEVSTARGWPEQAQRHYRAALDAVRGQGRHRETQDVLQAVAGLHEQAGDFPAALATYREALERAQTALDRLAHIEQRNDDLARDLRQARAEASSWQDSVRRAEAQARQDPLTGLLNRRGLQDALSELEEGAGTLLALFDIDHFKDVNDQHSHATGDAALRAVAACLTARLPAASLLARYGGEEFLLVLPGANPGDAAALVEGLRRAVEAHDWSALLPGMTLTVSAGYALTGGHDAEALRVAFEQADDHLYRAKGAGRNRVYPPALVLG
ncbi:diguanylate cyclase [Deinococcus phoenicis]|uniref:Diguanylate cyclase n=1 Tax=Deinococcus phoenicis TaxID=1476583 RepID=A0A016QN93_9DEIO|nr:diguanylate cyclase [Deinococcus phoenicis]EYB67590.1 diguanylate cyclase [Deinococcus phoenicis]